VDLRVEISGENAVITVADNGPGFAPEHRDRIFDRFYRTDGARTRVSGGTGLGLAIARWITETHGGTISADSVPGEGATFTVRLPLIAQATGRAPQASAASRKQVPASQAAPGIRS
jgi:signal transduction histidine kinase